MMQHFDGSIETEWRSEAASCIFHIKRDTTWCSLHGMSALVSQFVNEDVVVLKHPSVRRELGSV